jgi:uncharacterized membrane protein
MTHLLRLPLVLLISLHAVQLHWVGQTLAQENASPVDDEGRIVQFSRDIAPLFTAHCLECHNVRNAKNDFRIDLADSVADYIDPGEGATSTLMVEYLLSEDPDMLMPPPSHGGPLSAAELALIRVWIDEGAHWPDDAVFGDAESVGSVGAQPGPVLPSQPKSLLGRLWVFQGYFHPAVVHFPIALLLVGGLFVVIGWRYPTVGDQVAATCLFLGTASSIVASTMGWAFATQRGYGSWTRVDLDSEIFWHRWSAIIVTLLAIVVSGIAIRAMRTHHQGLHQVWRVGLLALAVMVGLVGHQGGELTYGKSHYQQAFEVLFGKAPPVPHGVEPTTAGEPADAVGQPEAN